MAHDALRAEVEAAVDAAFQRLGPKGFTRASVVSQFKDRAPSVPTLYRWIDVRVKSGKPSAMLAKRIKASAQKAVRSSARRGEGTVAATADVAARALASAPMVGIGAMLPGASTLDVLAELRACIEAGKQVMAHARNQDGSVKTASTLLSAADHVRRSVDSLVKLYETINNASAIDQFQREVIAILEETAREHPRIAPIILARLRVVTANWQV